MSESPLKSNLTEYSVSEISNAVKRTVEQAFDRVKIRGEISGYRGPHSSGHAYFRLKDERATLEAVVWRGVFSKLRFKPEEGLEVLVTGKMTTFPGSSKYQIVIEKLEPAGAGALMALLDERRRKLAQEGLFAESHKKSLPFLPKTIGVITSPTGAVIRDIVHRVKDRFPTHILVWPVRVQGETSSDEVVQAIKGFDALRPDHATLPKPDVLIIARGGGSLEDLWSFNEESVVRAASNCSIPIISAIGHETDWTLLDMVADQRAPTPTGAAEISVPVRKDLELSLQSLSLRLAQGQKQNFDQKHKSYQSLIRALPSLHNIILMAAQRLDSAFLRLQKALTARANQQRLRLQNLQHALTPKLLLQNIHYKALACQQNEQAMRHSIRHHFSQQKNAFLYWRKSLKSDMVIQKMRHHQDRLTQISQRFHRHRQQDLIQRSERLNAYAQLLNSYSYRHTLKRGFALIRDEKGKPMRNAHEMAAPSEILIEMHDGTVNATAHHHDQVRTAMAKQSAPANKTASKTPQQQKKAPANQKDLFHQL
jgi:exodeoxyribonuclease VII large subunit